VVAQDALCRITSLDGILLNTELIRSVDSIQPLLPTWRELTVGQPLLQPDWLLSWWRCFQEPKLELLLIVVKDAEQQVRGIAPLVRNLETKTIGMLGDGPGHSGCSTFLMDHRTSNRTIAYEIAKAIVALSKSGNEWRTLHLKSVNGCDPLMYAFKRAMISYGSKVYEHHPHESYSVNIPNGWQSLLDSQSSQVREEFRDRVQRLHDFRIRWVNDRVDWEEYFPVLLELHHRTQKALGRDGWFAASQYEPLLREWGMQLLDRNQLQAFTLWHGQRPMAAELGMRVKDRWLCQVSGFEPELAEHQPAKLSSIVILRDAERFGIKRIEFLRGCEPDLSPYDAQQEFLGDWDFTPPTFRGHLRHWIGKIKAATLK
jgi:CelD/BcsL family acetyltransferase involved in cellulose biosynthesis